MDIVFNLALLVVLTVVSALGMTLGLVDVVEFFPNYHGFLRILVAALALAAPFWLFSLWLTSIVYQRRLSRSMSETKEAQRIRNELVANVSHDLRSPLTSVQGFLETLVVRGTSLPPERQKEMLEIALRNTMSLSKLVADLLDLSRLEAEAAVPKQENFSLRELTSDLSARFVPRAEQKGVTMTIQCPEDLPTVRGDMRMIERALSNLVENAIYYTPNNGTVDVSLARKGSRVTVTIADSGVGIPEDELKFVFDRFYRVNKDRSKTTGGTGLGLAITKRIIEAHGSTISIESKPDQGTTVRFALPVSGGSSRT